MQASLSSRFSKQIRFTWILSPKKDLLFYIGSALVGWMYVGIIVFAILTLDNPLKDALAVVRIGGLNIPLTLEFLVVLSWALILDAPHVWATLGRTLFDPDEWRVRGREIRFSFIWFLIGPMAITLPYFVGSVTPFFGVTISAATLATGSILFFV
ncbi:hypothetical protein GWO43_23555, partial [candidate division KSB1 bacterium]|nr:hypothetical protein [candidate division KSB1 bacterium]NIT73792.1 hypothetical protein [candidate division KSB1 bacterium]NIX73472.1 hypothetical protein [candidate division KSB1 bacterium]